MPSDLLTPFVELDDPLCQAFLRLNVGEEPGLVARCPVGYQRAFSAGPAAPSGSAEPLEDGVSASDALWSLPDQWGWAPALPRTSLQHIPFRAERSASVIEGCREGAGAASSRYKTELCRTYEESGVCKYGAKCQFAHGAGELRGLSRHPKYKTELCRTFHTAGFCPYGSRCHFIHNAEEQRQPPRLGGRSPSFSRSASLSPSASPPAPGPCCCRHPAGEPPCLAFPATITLGQDGAGGGPGHPRCLRLPRAAVSAEEPFLRLPLGSGGIGRQQRVGVTGTGAQRAPAPPSSVACPSPTSRRLPGRALCRPRRKFGSGGSFHSGSSAACP